MKWYKGIIKSGVRDSQPQREQRAITLSNAIALILAGVNVLLFFIIPENHNLGAFHETSIAVAILGLPVVLNHFQLYRTSRLYLCWAAPLFYTWFMLFSMQSSNLISISTFDGLRFYLLAFSCIPYLIIERANVLLFIAGVIPCFICLVFPDFILDLLDLKIAANGVVLVDYSLAPVRAFVSYLIINASCFSLRVLLENGDVTNQRLVDEITQKNEQIQQQNKNEVNQLNAQLRVNLDQLSEREFILNQSQKIANVGSWEYRFPSREMYWSDEMYNIFGLNNRLGISLETFIESLLTEERPRLDFAMRNLFETAQPLDMVLRMRTPLGYSKWIRLHAFPLYEESKISGARGICHDITFYKESEERLRTSEEKFSKAFNSNPDLITIIRENDLAVLDTNEKITDILGFERHEIVGKSATSLNLFTNDGDRQKFFSSYFANGSMSFEGPWRRKDGKIIQVIISSIRIYISGEAHMMSVVKDITARKLAEEKFLQAFDLSPDLQLIFRERDLVLVEANKKLEAISGFTREEVIGANAPEMNLGIWAVPEERQSFFKEYYQSGAVFQEAQLHRKNKESFFATVGAQRIVLAGENHMLVVVHDVTETKIAQRDLIISQANLNATINNTEIMIWSVDRSFNLITYNKAFYDYMRMQYGIEITVGKRMFDAINTEDGDEMKAKWSRIYLRALSGEAVALEETRFGRDFNYSISPIIENSKVIGASIFAENVTERNSRDKALADAQRKIGELRLMALRSVMNPHFIFNVLNSIQFFIAKNDRLNAINYLSTFSKLIRSVLTHSINNKIKLSDEIDLLRNYVQLELTRFENKFDFILNIDPDVEVENIEIPSLLIQPFVENAILHGLYNKTSPGTLEITIKERNESIVFEIIDNGIGREAAAKLREQNHTMHKSMGMKVTEDRLKLINQHHNVVFETHDLVDANGSAGTRVVIGVKY